jgi:hypothetical protein
MNIAGNSRRTQFHNFYRDKTREQIKHAGQVFSNLEIKKSKAELLKNWFFRGVPSEN